MKESSENRNWIQVLIVLASIATIVSCLYLFIPHNGNTESTTQGNSSISPTNTSNPSSSNSITPTLSAPTSPPSAPGTLLYKADWSNGLNGWAGNSDWKAYNGMLLNDGSYRALDQPMLDSEGPSIVPPFQPNTILNYTITTQIQVLKIDGGFHTGFSIFARESQSDPSQGYRAGVGYEYGPVTFIGDGSSELVSTSYDPGTSVHTYKLDVKGINIKFYIDGGLILTTTSSKYLNGGSLGLLDGQTELEVLSYEVIAD